MIRPDSPRPVPSEMAGPLPTSLHHSLDVGAPGMASSQERQLSTAEGDPEDTDSCRLSADVHPAADALWMAHLCVHHTPVLASCSPY